MNVDEIKRCKVNKLGYFVISEVSSVKLGNYVNLGNDVNLGNCVTSDQLNHQFISSYKKLGKSHIFTKWITKDRTSPSFDGGTALEYKKGAVIAEPTAQISDKQCDAGLHVFVYGYRPEWSGLCTAYHNYIAIDVEVASEDICFAGMPGNFAKLRVKKLKVLN